MRIALDPGDPPRIRRLDDDGTPVGPVQELPDLAAVAVLEAEQPRWVLARPRSYRPLLAAGVRLRRAHVVELVEALLVAADGHAGAPHGLAAALDRAAGRVPAPDRRSTRARPGCSTPDRIATSSPTSSPSTPRSGPTRSTGCCSTPSRPAAWSPRR